MHISYADLDTCMFDGKQISIQNSPTINAQDYFIDYFYPSSVNAVWNTKSLFILC